MLLSNKKLKCVAGRCENFQRMNETQFLKSKKHPNVFYLLDSLYILPTHLSVKEDPDIVIQYIWIMILSTVII